MNMISITEIRKKYPQYDRLSDTELADRLYDKYYSDKLPKNDYYQKIGLGKDISNIKPSNIDNELQKKLQQESWFGKLGLGIPSSHIRNPLAGLLQGGKETGELFQSAIPPKGFSPLSFKSENLNRTPLEIMKSDNGQESPGINRAKSQDTWLQRFDPYKAMGVKEESLLDSIAGAEQAVGEYGLPLTGATKGTIHLSKSILDKLSQKLTRKGAIKDILKTEENMKEKYNKLYNDLWKEAEDKGLGNELIFKPKIDYHTLEKYTPKKKIDSVIDFKNNQTLNNAHHAKSELLRLQRELDKKTTLSGAEKKQHKAISTAIDEIENSMFKTKTGEIHPELSEKYKKIQSGYKEEAVPYVKNENIQAFKRKELTEEQLANKLRTGKFEAQRGEHHYLNRPDIIKKSLMTLGIGGAALGGMKELYDIYNYLRK